MIGLTGSQDHYVAIIMPMFRETFVKDAIDAGWIQKEIHRSAVTYQAALERGSKHIVGVNCFQEKEDANGPAIELHRIDPAVEREQHERLSELKRRRDPRAVQRELAAVRAACRDGSNLLARFVAAAHAYCTLGEIAQVLREEFGVYREPKIL